MDEKFLKKYIAEAFKKAVIKLVIEDSYVWFYDELYNYVDYDDIKDSFDFINDEIQTHFNALQHFLSKEMKERK